MKNEISSAIRDLLGSIDAYDADGGWSEALAEKAFHTVGVEGWSRVGLPEVLGGDGGELGDAAAVVSGVSSSGHLLPVADMAVCTTTLLRVSEVSVPTESGCVVPVAAIGDLRPDGTVSVSATRVPWARWASHLVVLAPDGVGTRVCIVDKSDADIESAHNLAGEPRDSVTVTAARPVDSGTVVASPAQALARLNEAGALARSIQISAAVDAVLSMTVRYCRERQQFGRSISTFQAVQQQLAALAGEAAAAEAAVTYALTALEDEWSVSAIAVAKVRTSMAAGVAASTAHQLHGAMGITREYPLNRYTRALWSWRDEYGGESRWASTLVGAVSEYGGLWEAMAPV